MTPDEAGQAIKSALGRVEGLRVSDDQAGLRPPAALVSAPSLRWDVGSVPTDAEFVVFIVVDVSTKALARLMDLLPKAVEAIESLVDNAAGPGGAEPATLVDGTTELPAYMFTVEVSL